jgi:pimeloyl-ACP methyl ester carboxylesterase
VPFAELDGVSLFFTDEGGEGSPILFVHGFSCDSHDWSWQIPYFADTHRVIAVDLRGHGRSSAPEDGYNPSQFASDIAALLERLSVGPVLAVGHSLGGAIVSVLAVEHPELVRGVVVVDPAYLLPDETAAAIAATMEYAGGDPIRCATLLLGHSDGAGSSPALRTWHMRRIAGTPSAVLEKTLSGSLAGVGALAYATQSRPFLRRRRCPVLAIYADPARAAIESQILADECSRVISWEGAGHWLHQERPAEFNALVDMWLANAGIG